MAENPTPSRKPTARPPYAVQDVYGGDGDDAITGDDAPNSLDGAYGSDPIYGGAERDFIDVSSDFEGGTADTVDCGRGKDEVMANPDDTIVPNREEVTTWDF